MTHEREPAGKNLQKGSFVRLLDLKSDKGKLMNECVGEITGDFIEGRFRVKVFTNDDMHRNNGYDKDRGGGGGGGGDNGIVKTFKPMNMRVVCSSCHKDGRNFKMCSLCNIACYCDKECQRRHWKKGQHKIHCPGNCTNDAKKKKNNASDGHDNTNTTDGGESLHSNARTRSENPGTRSHERLFEWDKSMDHPSWSKLIQASRHNLRRVHERSGCRIPWPVSVETPAMLDFTAPSFLIAHPNMEFTMISQNLVSPHGLSASKCMPILSEKVEMPYEEYLKKVPQHTPPIMTFAILAEVVWTKSCQKDMEHFFNDPKQAGAMFKWPAAECVGICPGTGKRVPYSFSKKHLLVVCNMQGNVFRGSEFHMLTRMMPRILTIEGYKKLIGPSKEDRSLTVKIASTTLSREGFSSTTWRDDDKDFYPGQLRIMNADKPKWLTASMAYEQFNTSGEYDLYEKYLHQKFNVFDP